MFREEHMSQKQRRGEKGVGKQNVELGRTKMEREETEDMEGSRRRRKEEEVKSGRMSKVEAGLRKTWDALKGKEGGLVKWGKERWKGRR